MTLSTQEIQAIYRRQARYYDFYLRLDALIGFRYRAHRARSARLLGLKRGDCVVELGCGTGSNFRFLEEGIGPEGRLIGVDLSSDMLAGAEERARREGWTNVELIQSDMASYDFPQVVNGVFSSGAFGYVPDHDELIRRISRALVPGGRLVISDLKRPEAWPEWLLGLAVGYLGRSFRVTPDYVAKRPWESVERYFEQTTFQQMFCGGVYVCAGTAPSRAG